MSYTIREIAGKFNLSEKAIYTAIAKQHIVAADSDTDKVPRYTKASVDRYWSRRLPESAYALTSESCGYFVPSEAFEALKDIAHTLNLQLNEFAPSKYHPPENLTADGDHQQTNNYTSKQIVDSFGVSVKTLYSAVQRGKIQRIPGTQLYTKESVESHWNKSNTGDSK